MDDISKIIFILYKKKFNGILNIASGKSIYLKDIAMEILKKYKKKIIHSKIMKLHPHWLGIIQN